MKTRSVVPMTVAKTGYVVMSIVFCAMGVMCIIRPNISLTLLGRIIGIAMMVFGAVKIVGFFSKDLFRLAFQYDLEIGILLIALGMVFTLKTELVMSFIFIVFGVVLLIDGLFKIRIAKESRTFGIKEWWCILTLALCAGVSGLLLIFELWEDTEALAVLMGISMIIEGGLNLCVALSTVKIVKNQKPDVIEEDYQE